MFAFSIPGTMTDGALRLRPVKVSDCPRLLSGLNSQDILKVNGMTSPLSASRISLWWWMKKTFDLARIIEHEGSTIGFIGLYDLRIKTSAKMSLIIFDREHRNRGYGSRAFHVLMRHIRTCLPIQKIVIEVQRDNTPGMSFWRKCGFHDCKEGMMIEPVS
jgi:RimJ/RimL family protein N-acetyltransferase